LQRLKPKYDEPLSNFAFYFNLRRYLSEEVFPYDINANAHAYEAETTYSHDMMSDAYWRGPVYLPAKS